MHFSKHTRRKIPFNSLCIFEQRHPSSPRCSRQCKWKESVLHLGSGISTINTICVRREENLRVKNEKWHEIISSCNALFILNLIVPQNTIGKIQALNYADLCTFITVINTTFILDCSKLITTLLLVII